MLSERAVSYYKLAKEYAPGIPKKEEYGLIPTFEKPKVIRWVIHKHQAEKAGLHYDLRLNLQGNQAFSWALRNDLPQVGGRILAVQQPVHTKQYMDFAGTIPSGYGKGSVSIYKSGNVDLLYCSPKK